MPAELHGTDRLNGWLAQLPRNIMSEVKEELEDISEELEDKAVFAAPYDTGALKDSSFRIVHYTSTGLTMIVGFQGLPYIIVQHEKGWLDYMGSAHPDTVKPIRRYHNGGGEKFLEHPWLENKRRYVRQLHAAVKRGARK